MPSVIFTLHCFVKKNVELASENAVIEGRDETFTEGMLII